MGPRRPTASDATAPPTGSLDSYFPLACATPLPLPRRHCEGRARAGVEVRQHAPWRTALAGDGADECSCWVDAYSLPLLVRYDPAPVHALLVPLEPVHPLAAVWPRLLTFRQLDEPRKPPKSIYEGLVVQANG